MDLSYRNTDNGDTFPTNLPYVFHTALSFIEKEIIGIIDVLADGNLFLIFLNG